MNDVICELKSVLQNLEEAKEQISEQQEEIRNLISMLMMNEEGNGNG